MEEERTMRRQVREIRPVDPSPDINNSEPPTFSLKGVFSIVREKGLIKALSDDAWGPHVHLVLLLSLIITIAICVAFIQLMF